MASFFQILDAILSSHKSIKASVGLALFGFCLWWLYAPSSDTDANEQSTGQQTIQAMKVDSGGGPTTDTSAASRMIEPPIIHNAVTAGPTPAAIPNLTHELQAIEVEATKERIELLVSNLEKLENLRVAWATRATELTENDSGRRMVNNAQVFPVVVSLLRADVVPESDFFVLRKQVATLERQLPSLSPTSHLDELNGALAKCDQQLIDLRDPIEKAWLSLSSLEKQCQTLSPASITLGEAIAKQAKDDATKWAENIRALNEEAERKARAMEAEKETARLQQEMERRKAVAEAELKRQADETMALRKQAEQKAERARLEAEFNRDLPQIQHYLSPLFAHGYTQPKNYNEAEQFVEKGPMSLAAIKSFGALNQPNGTEGGFVKLLLLFNAASNDRTVRGPYPKYTGGSLNSHETEAIRPAYLLLLKYQNLLVEKGYLAP